MNKKLLVVTFLASLLPLFAQAEKLTIAGSEAVGSLLDRMSIKLAADIKKYSDGNLDVNLIRGNAMGTAPQVIQLQMMGTVDVNFTRPEYYSEYVPEFGIMSWGLTFDNREHMDKFFASKYFERWNNDLISSVNIRILAAGPDQARVMFSTKSIDNADEIKKLKIRVPQITTYLKFWQATGAQPTQVDWSEVFLSLNSGLVEAAEADYSGAMSQKFHIAAPYITETDHVFSAASISINESKYQSLTKQNKAAVEKAAQEAVTWLREEAKNDSNKVKQIMISEGAKVSTIDRSSLIETAGSAAYTMEKQGLWPKGTWDEIKSVR